MEACKNQLARPRKHRFHFKQVQCRSMQPLQSYRHDTKGMRTDRRTDGFSALYSRLANAPTLSCRLLKPIQSTMSIPSLLCLCSQPTLSVIPTRTITYLVCHDCLVIVFHVYPVGKADCSLLCLPSLLRLPKAVMHASFAYLGIYSLLCLHIASLLHAVIYIHMTYVQVICFCNLQSSMPLYYAYLSQLLHLSRILCLLQSSMPIQSPVSMHKIVQSSMPLYYAYLTQLLYLPSLLGLLQYSMPKQSPVSIHFLVSTCTESICLPSVLLSLQPTQC